MAEDNNNKPEKTNNKDSEQAKSSFGFTALAIANAVANAVGDAVGDAINNAVEVVQNWWKNNISPYLSRKPKATREDKANANLAHDKEDLARVTENLDLTKAQEKTEEVQSVTPQIADEHSKQNSTIAEQVSAFLHDVWHGDEKVRAHLEAASKSTEKVLAALDEANKLTGQLHTLNKAAQEKLVTKALSPETQKELAAIKKELIHETPLHKAIERSKQVSAALASERANAPKNGRSH